MSLAERMAGNNRLKAAKILTFDIETSPNVGFHWGLWNQNIGINQIVEPGRVLCWAAKWWGTKKVEFASDHHDGHDTMVRRIHELLDQADITVGYNHRKFDLKHLHREFWLAGLTPPSPHKDVDLLTEVRRTFAFPSNKLDYVAQQTGIGQKVQHEGFSLWRSCLDGDPAAWGRMKRYCVGDVRLTEALYDHLRGWMPSHPHSKAAVADDRATCNQCYGDNLVRHGTKLANQIVYVLWRCSDCGANVQGVRHSRAATSRGAR